MTKRQRRALAGLFLGGIFGALLTSTAGIKISIFGGLVLGTIGLIIGYYSKRRTVVRHGRK